MNAYDLQTEPFENFPCVITSRSARNRGGGLLNVRQTKQQVKIDAVERKLDELAADERGADGLTELLAAKRKLLKRVAD